MESLHLANMVAHSGKRKELAKQLLIVQDALDNLARFAGSDRISPTHLKAWTEGLVSPVSYTAMAALDLHTNLTNLDVLGEIGCSEQDVNPDELYDTAARLRRQRSAGITNRQMYGADGSVALGLNPNDEVSA